jgi:hypothetical protein
MIWHDLRLWLFLGFPVAQCGEQAGGLERMRMTRLDHPHPFRNWCFEILVALPLTRTRPQNCPVAPVT